MSQYIEEVNERNFDRITLQPQIPVLVDFRAEWGRPCPGRLAIVEAVAARTDSAFRQA